MYKILVDGKTFCDSRIDDLAVINPVVTIEANKAGSLVFTIPPAHPHYDLIERRKSIITVVRGSEVVFEGICTEEGTDFFKQKKITCEGDLTYLNDTILRQVHYSGVSVLELLTDYINKHNEQVPENKRFEVGVVTVTDPNNYISCYTNMQSPMEEIKSDLVDDLGGYIRVRHENGKRYIDYLQDAPRVSNQKIELGKNLLDYKSNIDNTDIATRIIPLGAKLDAQEVPGLDARVTIKSVNSGVDFLESSLVDRFGVITKVVTWDNVNSPQILKTKAQNYLTEIQFDNVVIEASAVDLGMLSDKIDKFKLLDSVQVISPAHGMDRYMTITKMTMNLNNPEKDVIRLGADDKVSLSAKTNKINTELMQQLEHIPTAISIIQQAVNNASNLIGGADGGYVKINDSDGDGKPDEILVMDSPSEDKAKNLWRWNKNGFGFSSDGGKTYGIAMTMDGHIVGTYLAIQELAALGATIGGWDITKDSISSYSNSTILDANLIGDTNQHISELYIGNGSYKSAYGNGAHKEDEYDEQGNIVNYSYTYTTERETVIDGGRISMLCDGEYDGIKIQQYKYDQGVPYGDYRSELGYYGLDVKKKNASGVYNSVLKAYAGGVALITQSGTFTVAENSDGYPILTMPGYTFMHSMSTQSVPAQFTSTATFRGSVYNSTGGVVFTSDRDKKHDINALNGRETSKFIYSLKPCEFKYNDGTSDRFHHGLIAQEVKEAMDSDWGLYVECEDGTKALRYDELIADLIATVQTQNERIKELEDKVNG